MYEINWNRFALKNPDAQTAFEAMCRTLFLRKYKIGGYDFSSNFNQAGIEIEPILYNEKYFGFQCKYSTSGNSTAFYQELLDSLKTAANAYPKLDTIIVYTNLDIKPNLTLTERLKLKNSNRKRILDLAGNESINLIWVCKTNFEQILNEITNLDLYRLYFSPQDELGFLSASLAVQERTFLNSNFFVDLSVNGSKFSQLQDEILEAPFSVITGAAGTGKSELLKKLFLKAEKDYMSDFTGNQTTEHAPIPIFIRLRDCIKGNLEDLLRSRLRDYQIAANCNSCNFIYFFDGIDEVNSADFIGISVCLMRLHSKQDTKSIILSSRTNTTNLTTVYRDFSVKKISIADLSPADIEDYFRKRADKEKSELLSNIQRDLIADITDIFSVVLLWENIKRINSTTTRIDLIELTVKSLILRNGKYLTLNLPKPKVVSIETILGNISVEMQRTKRINISRTALQQIVGTLFSKMNYQEIDTVIDYISENFFDHSPLSSNQQTYSYRHKRYFELYLYYSVRQIFYEEPSVLRELQLLPNKDFMLNIFLPQELKDNIKNNDLHKVLVLRFLEAYLGDDYIGDKRSPWFIKESSFSSGSKSYLDSPQIRRYLCSKEYEDLYSFFKNDPLSISSLLKRDNYWSFIILYYRTRHQDIRPLLDDIFQFDISWKKEAISNDPCSYWLCKCVIDGIPVEDIFSSIVKELDYKNIAVNLDYVSSYSHDNTSIAVGFFEMAIELYPEWMTSSILSLSIEQLEVVCYALLRTKLTWCLFSKDAYMVALRNEICNRIASSKEEFYKINTVVLYNILSKQFIQKADVEARLARANVYHYGTWEDNLELNCYAAILQKDDFHAMHTDFLLGISIRQILLQNYSENKASTLDLILHEIKKYNLIYRNWFSFNNSVLVGELLSGLEFDVTDIKQFISELRKYPSVISLFTVLYSIMEKNYELFTSIANQQIITSAYDSASRSISYYDNNSNIGLMYATMMSCFDLTNGDTLFEDALNNSVFRPIFRKEDIVDYYLPLCLLIAYNSGWLTMSELEKAVDRIDKMLDICSDTLDSGDYREYFKFLLEKSLPDSPILLKLHDWDSSSPYRHLDWTSGVSEIKPEGLSTEDLAKYYNCEIDGINYSAISVWKTLIKFEYQHDPELHILYQTLDKNYFPVQDISRINSCFHIITAVLISDTETRACAIQYMMRRGGRLGLVNMIKAFSLTGNDAHARQYFESLLSLCEALVYPRKAQIDANREKWEHGAAITEMVCNSSREQWNIDDESNRMFFSKDPKVSIKWDDTDHDELFVGKRKVIRRVKIEIRLWDNILEKS